MADTYLLYKLINTYKNGDKQFTRRSTITVRKFETGVSDGVGPAVTGRTGNEAVSPVTAEPAAGRRR
jgi:hypothetical protein